MYQLIANSPFLSTRYSRCAVVWEIWANLYVKILVNSFFRLYTVNLNNINNDHQRPVPELRVLDSEVAISVRKDVLLQQMHGHLGCRGVNTWPASR